MAISKVVGSFDEAVLLIGGFGGPGECPAYLIAAVAQLTTPSADKLVGKWPATVLVDVSSSCPDPEAYQIGAVPSLRPITANDSEPRRSRFP